MSMEFPNPNWTGTTTVTVIDNSGGASTILDLNDPWTVRAENYFKAEIASGRVGAAQSPPRREF